MMYNQNLDIQVWKLLGVENGKYGNKIKLMEIVGEFNGKKVNQKEEKTEGKSLIRSSPKSQEQKDQTNTSYSSGCQ